MKCKIYIFLALLLLIFMLSSVNILAENSPEVEPYSEVLLVNNDSGVQYQAKILEEFNRTSEVPILVKLYSKNMTKVDQILSTLSEMEFKLKGKLLLGNGFGGNITKEGFEKLINNSDIKMIYLDEPLHVALDKSRLLINADDVETAGYTGKYQTICVLDTGIDYNHTALGGCFGSGCKVRAGWNYVVPEGHPDEDDPDDGNGYGTEY